ncbi:MAG: hypothetical protein DRP42_03310 [Tenericutes bacterium]|nr:MAG: hypothetical protein DRP42_03310 [Mycoplasmatota bacterium]
MRGLPIDRTGEDFRLGALFAFKGTADFSSEISIPLDYNTSVDGRAVNAREKLSVPGVDAGGVTAECAEPHREVKTVSKLLRPPLLANGCASQTAVINHLIVRQCHVQGRSCPISIRMVE